MVVFSNKMDNNYLKAIDYFKQTNEEYYVVFLLNKIKYAINIQNVLEIINSPVLEIPEK